MREPVPVTVITGFLGAGKTTLVNRLLANVRRGEVAVLVNEHGSIGIDGTLLAARVERLIEIAGGCVCCETQAAFVRALDAIATSEPAPKRILVETSGAASPAGVLRAISGRGRRGTCALDGILTVVDPTRTEALLAHGLALEQVGYADVVVLSRADVVEASELSHAERLIALHNPAAVVAAGAADSLDELLGRRTRHVAAPPPVRPNAAPHAYQSISLALEGELDGERFADFMEGELARFAGRIFRIKGVLALAGVDERMIVQGVTDRVEVSFGDAWGKQPRTSRLVVVGFGIDGPAIDRAFRACQQP